MTNWKKELTELKHQYLEKTAKAFYDASGGRKGLIIKPYSDNNTNRLTNAVMDWLKFKGHYANRINTMGTIRKLANGSMKFTPSSTRKGTADIHAIMGGKHVSLEIKCKATRDRMSDEQRAEKARIENAGGLYYVVTDMDSFTKWYKVNFENIIISENSINMAK